MGMVHAIQKGELDPQKLRKKERLVAAAQSMDPGDARDFAATKTEALPERAKSAQVNPFGWLLMHKRADFNAKLDKATKALHQVEAVRRQQVEQHMRNLEQANKRMQEQVKAQTAQAEHAQEELQATKQKAEQDAAAANQQAQMQQMAGQQATQLALASQSPSMPAAQPPFGAAAAMVMGNQPAAPSGAQASPH